MSGAGNVEQSVRLSAARRVIQAHGGAVNQAPQGLTIAVPLEAKARMSDGR